MKIRDLMISDVISCRNDTNLACVGAMMWEHDCGFIPVVDETNKVTGVVTDRDICIALCTRDARSSDLKAGDVATSKIVTCTANEDVRTAVDVMRNEKLHRLPVVDEDGLLRGIVSMDDILMYAEKPTGKAGTDVPLDDVVQALQAIAAHHQSRQLVVMA
jgi:CBS domain-containing protein